LNLSSLDKSNLSEKSFANPAASLARGGKRLAAFDDHHKQYDPCHHLCRSFGRIAADLRLQFDEIGENIGLSR
jgi:hypothetical protein